MPRLGALSNAAQRRIVLLSAALLLVRIASAMIVDQPGYTDAYYYHDVARRLAAGQGLTADFVWNPLEAPPGASLPVPSHRFWMPLASVLQALGIVLLPFFDSFRASQALTIAIAACIPLVTYAAARSLGGTPRAALVAATLAGLGGAFAPGWVSLDAFAPAAVLGTLFFLAYGRAARGGVPAGALAGLLVGLLFLARGEGALFGLVLVGLALRPVSRRAGLLGSAVALTIGFAWLARDIAIGLPTGLFARTAFLLRYEDFFALEPPTMSAVAAHLPEFFGAKAAALATNLLTLAVSFGFVLVPPMVLAIRAHADRAAVRAFCGLLVLLYLAESLLWTLHSTRGSYFHSLAAFFPFGIALGLIGSGRLFVRRAWDRRAVHVIALTGIAAAVAVSGVAVAQWDATFGPPYRARAAALARIPPGPFLALDAAAWRWISGRTVVVTPADGPGAAACYAPATGVSSIVIEPAHFTRYDELYRGRGTGLAEATRETGRLIRVYSLPSGCLP
ncbi:MAG: hypothetical protein NVS9B6_04860 [Candidatus Limnocylindrales bacterium]